MMTKAVCIITETDKVISEELWHACERTDQILTLGLSMYDCALQARNKLESVSVKQKGDEIKGTGKERQERPERETGKISKFAIVLSKAIHLPRDPSLLLD